MKKTHLLKKIRYLLMAIAFPIILLTLFIVIDGVTDERKSADLIVILGNKINPDGNPVERLAQRLDKGLELYQDSLAPLIMVSGGIAEEGFAEGTVMADYLIKKGVPQSAILIDNDGWKTFFYSKKCQNINGSTRLFFCFGRFSILPRPPNETGFSTVWNYRSLRHSCRWLSHFERLLFPAPRGCWIYLLFPSKI